MLYLPLGVSDPTIFLHALLNGIDRSDLKYESVVHKSTIIPPQFIARLGVLIRNTDGIVGPFVLYLGSSLSLITLKGGGGV